MKGTSSVRRLRLRSVCLFFLPQCNGGLKLLWVCLCVRSYRVFLESPVADRIGMAASRLLAAAAACVILLSFAAEDCKSYWSGCIQAAIVICQQIFAILALVIFLLKFLLKNVSKSSFFCFGVEIRFWSCNSCVEKFVCKRLPCVKALCASTVCKCSVSKRLLCVKACCV